MKFRKPLRLAYFFAFALLVSFSATVVFRAKAFFRPQELSEVQKKEQEKKLEEFLLFEYPEHGKNLIPLPYGTGQVNLDVWADSAICVDVANGNILYEKNADEPVPPASMTKLFAMYVVLNEVRNGNISLSDIVPLPPECWACNMPPHSSLMFLGKNQIVTVRELLTGLSVCSGNDAAYALAFFTFGAMEEFVRRMNDVALSMGLTDTRFVESSGYSEQNSTTARDMASFSRAYIRTFPEAMEFHSALSFSYPKLKNLSPEDRAKERQQDFSKGLPENITMEITQNNTNPLLPLLKGCDGLKTGYIDESGYNLSLTCKRDGIRFLSVTMRGPGKSQSEGQAGRVHDGKEIMEWAFRTFREYRNPLALRPYSIPVFYSERSRLELVPAWKSECLLVPSVLAKNPEKAENEVAVKVDFPDFINDGYIPMGKIYGKIEYSVSGTVLETIPLVSARELKKVNFWLRSADFAVQIIYRIKCRVKA